MKNISLEMAKGWSRRGWERGQTKKCYLKRPHATIYDLVDQVPSYMVNYDAMDMEELLKIAERINFIPRSKDFTVETLSENILAFCKYLKIKINDIQI